MIMLIIYMHVHPSIQMFCYCMLFALLTDINECRENTSMCEHNCVNIDGGYNCTCESEHTLATDFYNCLGKLNLRTHCHLSHLEFENEKCHHEPLSDCFPRPLHSYSIWENVFVA